MIYQSKEYGEIQALPLPGEDGALRLFVKTAKGQKLVVVPSGASDADTEAAVIATAKVIDETPPPTNLRRQSMLAAQAAQR